MKTSHKKIFRANVILAFCLVVTGLLANPWALGYLMRNSYFFLQDLIIIGLFEVFLVTAGLMVYFKGNTPAERKQLIFSFIGLILAIATIEGGLHIIDSIVHREKPPAGGAVVDRRKLSLSPYRDVSWAASLWGEYAEADVFEYEPFREWKHKEYHGQYLNIDSNGVRKTWNPERRAGAAPGSIYMFGGSTIWGYGARDDYTIPSQLSNLISNNGYDFRVENYGEGAYTFTQEVIRLVLLLKDGHRPDYVIFYDGWNDVYAAYQNGAPGGIQNETIIREKLGTGKTRPVQFRLALSELRVFLVEHSMIYRALGNISNLAPATFRRQGLGFHEAASNYTDEQLRELSDGIVANYLGAIELLDRLSQVYGFKYVCFWQPITFTEQKLTDEEQTYEMVDDKAQGDLHRMTSASLMAKPPPHFYSLADALGNRTMTYYIDYGHISEEGNAVIASRIFDVFKSEFLKGKAK